MLSLVIPLYKSEEGLPRLLTELLKLQQELQPEPFEAVFVVDGSPDRCYESLVERLPTLPLRAQLIQLSRNFGSFAAIAAGLSSASGDIFAVLAADLQEPPQLVLEFARILRANQADVCFGLRAGRSDPWLSELMSSLFWRLYRRFVVKDMPAGGVDVFGCNLAVRDHLLALPEVNSNLIGLLFWLGFRRKFVSYQRRPRLEGRSAWTFSKKLKYSFIRELRPLDRARIGSALGPLAGNHPGSRVYPDCPDDHVFWRVDGAGSRHHRPVSLALASERKTAAQLRRSISSNVSGG